MPISRAEVPRDALRMLLEDSLVRDIFTCDPTSIPGYLDVIEQPMFIERILVCSTFIHEKQNCNREMLY